MSRLRAIRRRLTAVLLDPGNAVPVILIAAFVARAVWLDLPRGTLIFDEAYYVNAARTILGWAVEPGAHYAGATPGLDPNIEHPPLGKALMAGSMLLFGDSGLGWRLPSLLAGMVALGAFYLIVRSAGETPWFATLALAFLAFDNLTLVHGRIGTLDMLALAPTLVGAWQALRGRWAVAGALVAIGVLIKITALYALLALLVLLVLDAVAKRRSGSFGAADLRPLVALVLSFSVVALGGLWALDSAFTTFSTPFAHIGHMLSYGTSLTEPSDRSGICFAASSAPWQWPFNECQINYLRVDVTVDDGDVQSRLATIDFRGALNPLLAGAMPLATLAAAWLAWRGQSAMARWAVVWAAAHYLPLVVLSLVGNRVTYIYYVLPAVPAVAIFTALLLLRLGLPRFVTWGFGVAYAVGFAAYFPFREIP